MSRNLRISLLIALSATAACAGCAQHCDHPYQIIDELNDSQEKSAADVAALVVKLGDDKWSVREEAQKRLEAMPPDVLDAVKAAVEKSQDPEVHLRGARAIGVIEIRAKIAGEEEEREVREKLAKNKITFCTDGQPLSEMTEFFSRLSGIDIVVDPGIKDKRLNNLQLKEVSLGAALRWTARSAGCGCAVIKGGTVVFSPYIEMPPEKTDGPWVKEVKDKLSIPITFDLDKQSLLEAITFLRGLTGVTIVPGTDVDGEKLITLKVENMPAEIALRWIARLSGVGYEFAEEGIVHVSGKAPLPEGETDGEWKKAIEQKMKQLVSFHFENHPLVEAVTFFQRLSGITFVIDRNVDPTAKVTLTCKEVSMSEAFGEICKACKVEYSLLDRAVYVHGAKSR
jgi:hypothetical protein